MDKNRRRESTASQETFISLQQLDPSPIDSPDEEEGSYSYGVDGKESDPGEKGQDLQKDIEALKRSGSSFIGLSGNGGGHSSVYYLTRLQKYTSITFLAFTTAHITNTSLIPLITRSLPTSEKYLLLTRPYYQSFPLEPLLITLPIATHIISGLILRIQKRNSNLSRYGAANLSISKRLEGKVRIWPQMSWNAVSGYILAPLVLGHAVVNRMLPWVYEGGSSGIGLGYVAHGFAKHPFLATTGYVALIITAAGHIVWGMARWNGLTPSFIRGTQKQKNRRWWIINGAMVFLAGTWMAGGLGVVARGGKASGWIGEGYDMLYSKVPFLKL